MKALALALGFAVVLTLPAAAEPSPEAAATLVLYNANQPESRALAKYYAERRGIPTERLLGLDCSGEEEISREEYRRTIEEPVRAAFDKNDWWSLAVGSEGQPIVERSDVRFVAILRGVPMKVAPVPADPRAAPTPTPATEIERRIGPHTEASVDSELAALFAFRDDPSAAVPNPYFRRFDRILAIPPAQTPLLVARLDAATGAEVRRMIDDALFAEENGLAGWAYVDARRTTDPGLVEGDNWMRGATRWMLRQGVPVILDDGPELLDEAFPVTDAAIYYGWYAGDVVGPFAREEMRFVRGAVAVHLHSFSARTLRDPRAGWVAPLLARGAAVTMGNVYEPYLGLTVHFDLLQDRLMNGFTVAEAAYAATRALSWMNVVVGDPLYRPYARWQSLAPEADNIWTRYRQAVREAGGVVAAGKALGALAKESGRSMPLEALAQAQAFDGLRLGALTTLDEATELASDPAVRFRLVLERVEILRRFGFDDQARRAVADALGETWTEDQKLALGRLAQLLTASPLPGP